MLDHYGRSLNPPQNSLENQASQLRQTYNQTSVEHDSQEIQATISATVVQ